MTQKEKAVIVQCHGQSARHFNVLEGAPRNHLRRKDRINLSPTPTNHNVMETSRNKIRAAREADQDGEATVHFETPNNPLNKIKEGNLKHGGKRSPKG